jgi:hypothetical protein
MPDRDFRALDCEDGAPKRESAPLSRVAGTLRRVAGALSRVAGALSRVVGTLSRVAGPPGREAVTRNREVEPPSRVPLPPGRRPRHLWPRRVDLRLERVRPGLGASGTRPETYTAPVGPSDPALEPSRPFNNPFASF